MKPCRNFTNRILPTFPLAYLPTTCKASLKLKNGVLAEECYLNKLSENTYNPSNSGNPVNGTKGSEINQTNSLIQGLE